MASLGMASRRSMACLTRLRLSVICVSRQPLLPDPGVATRRNSPRTNSAAVAWTPGRSSRSGDPQAAGRGLPDADHLHAGSRCQGTSGTRWLHGGAWMFGSGSSPQNDGARLAREGDLVVVGVNYRLGALGWLHRPGIVDAELATSDMVAALAWVHDNIAGFGGDPSRVTLMGQSAGAMSIARLILLPEARTLFQRVIMESAGLGRGFLTPARAAMIADQFLGLLDIDPIQLTRWRGCGRLNCPG